MVRQNPITENYTLGPATLRMGQAYLLNSDLVNRVRPFLLNLHSELDETICFVKLISEDTHYPITIPSSRSVNVAPRHGKIMSANDTLAGKLLSDQDLTSDFISDDAQIEKDVSASCMIIRGLGNSVLGAVEILEPSFRANMKRSRACLEHAVSEINACFANESKPASLSSQMTKEITRSDTDILTTEEALSADVRTIS